MDDIADTAVAAGAGVMQRVAGWLTALLLVAVMFSAAAAMSHLMLKGWMSPRPQAQAQARSSAQETIVDSTRHAGRR